MKTDKVTIKKSAIEGKGVFATQNFKKGDVVLQWDVTHIIPKEKVDKMSNKDKKYISYMNKQFVIMQEPEKYVNHSCEPNTTAKNFCDIALRDINEGEEITGNYFEELPPDTRMKCHCKSKNCKKRIES